MKPQMHVVVWNWVSETPVLRPKSTTFSSDISLPASFAVRLDGSGEVFKAYIESASISNGQFIVHVAISCELSEGLPTFSFNGERLFSYAGVPNDQKVV